MDAAAAADHVNDEDGCGGGCDRDNGDDGGDDGDHDDGVTRGDVQDVLCPMQRGRGGDFGRGQGRRQENWQIFPPSEAVAACDQRLHREFRCGRVP